MTLNLVDCQGFAGGLTLGVVQAGFKLTHKAEEPAGFGMPLCEVNRHILGDEWKADAAEPAEWGVPSGGVTLLAGNPPCSGFSVMSPKSFRGIDSPVNQCMRNLFAYAERLRPEAIVMESVTSAFRIGLPLMRELAFTFTEKMGGKWQVTHVIQNNLSLGGCSRRLRYFLVVTSFPFGVEPAPLRWVPTVRDAVGDLRDLELKWESQPYQRPPTWWSHARRSLDGTTDGHATPVLAPKSAERFNDIVSGVDWPEGASWDAVVKAYYEKHGDLPESFKYQSSSRDWSHLTRDKVLIQKDFKAGGYSQTRYWPWYEPAYVMTGHGPSQVWHPEKRLFTHREAARVMGFPDNWKIAPLSRDRNLGSYWGKGVSVDCGRWVGTWVRESLNGWPGSILGEEMPDGDDIFIDASSWWKQAPAVGQPASKFHAETLELPSEDRRG